MELSFQKLGDGLGISKQRAAVLVGKGMPRTLEAASDWRKQNLNPAQRKPPVDAVDVAAMFRVANDETFEQARTRKEIALADQAEMEAAERRGLLVEAAKSRAAWSKHTAAVREGLLTISSRLGPLLGQEAQRLIETEIRAALAQFETSL